MSIETILDWSSLAHESALEHQLYGVASKRVPNWLKRQLDFIHDQGFAQLFSDNINKFDVPSKAYNHRLIETETGALLGGIRFYGLDVERPFVEVIAHNFLELDDLRDVVRKEWVVFSAQSLRLTASANTMPTADAVLDVSINAATYGDMENSTGEVVLSRDVNLPETEAMIGARYERIKYDQIELARNISPAGSDELTDCHENEGLYVASIAGMSKPIGAIAVREGSIAWLEGDEVVEEVIALCAMGNGYATQMQTVLAEQRRIRTPDRFLIGTIDRNNHASRKSAERAGRLEIMRRVFLPL